MISRWIFQRPTFQRYLKNAVKEPTIVTNIPLIKNLKEGRANALTIDEAIGAASPAIRRRAEFAPRSGYRRNFVVHKQGWHSSFCPLQ